MPSAAVSSTLPNMTGHYIDEGSIQLVSLLGSGAYGKVYRAYDRDAKTHVAVKCMPTHEPGSRSARIQNSELELHALFSGPIAHARIIRLIRQFTEDDHVFAVLELAEDGDLYSALVERRLFSADNTTALVKQVMNELIDAVEHMHAHGVFHRDIKPQNILCDAAGTNVRLADFGLATRDELSEQLGCGTRLYMSPESLNPARSTPYSPRHSDLWALAVLFTALICQRPPWDAAEQSNAGFAGFCDNKEYLLEALPITQPTYELLARCFSPNPSERPTLQEFRDGVNSNECFTVPPRVQVPTVPRPAVKATPQPRPAFVPVPVVVRAAARNIAAPRRRMIQALSSSSSSSSSNSDSDSNTRSTPPTSPASGSSLCAPARLIPAAKPRAPVTTVAQNARPALPTCRQFRVAAANNKHGIQ